MKLTKSQLKQIIKEEIEEILPRSEAAAKTYDELAAQIAEMILAHDKELFGEAGGMDRGALLYVLAQTEKRYNELAAQGLQFSNEDGGQKNSAGMAYDLADAISGMEAGETTSEQMDAYIELFRALDAVGVDLERVMMAAL